MYYINIIIITVHELYVHFIHAVNDLFTHTDHIPTSPFIFGISVLKQHIVLQDRFVCIYLSIKQCQTFQYKEYLIVPRK